MQTRALPDPGRFHCTEKSRMKSGRVRYTFLSGSDLLASTCCSSLTRSPTPAHPPL